MEQKKQDWKGSNVPSQAEISVRTPVPAPKALVVDLGPTVGSASPTLLTSKSPKLLTSDVLMVSGWAAWLHALRTFRPLQSKMGAAFF